MSQIMAKRLGAAANNLPYHHRHVRFFTTSTPWQTARDYKAEHRDNIVFLQQEDQKVLSETINLLDKYHNKVREGQALLESLPPVLDPGPGSKILGSVNVQQARISQLTGRLETITDKLLNLRKHLEDLQNEPYPELGASDADLRFKADIEKMDERDRMRLLNEYTSKSNGMSNRLRENYENLRTKNIKMASEQTILPNARQAYPFGPSADAAKARLDEELTNASNVMKFGLDAAKKSGRKPKQFMKPALSFRKLKNVEEDKTRLGVEPSSGAKQTVWKPYELPPAKEEAADERSDERPPDNDLQRLQAKLERSWGRR